MRWYRNGLECRPEYSWAVTHSAEIDRPAFGYAEECDNKAELYLFVNQNQMDEMSKG